jgi:hypothetical protein
MNAHKACVLLFVLLGSPSLAAQTGCVEGRVLDTVGAPVPFIFVTASALDRSASHQVETDSDGYFFADVPAGEYDVIATDRSDLASPGVVQAEPGDALRTKVIAGKSCSSVSLRQPQRARLRFMATNALTEEFVDSVDASFRLNAKERWRGGTNEQQELLVPANSSLEVQVSARGYEDPELLQISPLQPGEAREVPVTLRPVAMGCITGTAVDEQGSPLGNATLQTSSQTQGGSCGRASTDASGHFRFDEVQPGAYTLFTQAKGYPLPGVEDGSVARVAVPPGRVCPEVSIRLGRKAARLSVKIADGVTRKPVKGAEVWVSGEYIQGGGWSLRAIADPTLVPALTAFEIHVTAQGYLKAPPRAFLPMQPEETQQLTIALQPESQKSAR